MRLATGTRVPEKAFTPLHEIPIEISSNDEENERERARERERGREEKCERQT